MYQTQFIWLGILSLCIGIFYTLYLFKKEKKSLKWLNFNPKPKHTFKVTHFFHSFIHAHRFKQESFKESDNSLACEYFEFC